MPNKNHQGTYPADWHKIAALVKHEAWGRCIRCGRPHDPEAGYMLTVHHADNDKSNCKWWNLLALCQRCHLTVQAKVDLDRPWVLVPHTSWFAPYAAGFYAWKYLAADLTRDEVMANLGFLLRVERAVILGHGQMAVGYLE